MNYEKLGTELKKIVSLKFYSITESIILSAPKSRQTLLLKQAGFFQTSQFAELHGFSRQYAHKFLNKSEYHRFTINGSVWWIKPQ